MADEHKVGGDAPVFNLGIQDVSVHGNLQAAEAFLNEEEAVTDPAKLVVATEEDKKKTPAKKEEAPKAEEKKEDAPDPNKLINNFLEEDEEPKKEDEEEDPKKQEEPKKEEGEDLNYFETFSEELYKLGSFTTEEGEDPVIAKTPEEFVDLFNKQKQKGATDWLENFLAKHGEDRRELFDAIFVNGVDPEKYLPVYNEVVSFEGMDLEKEENQESAVRSYYTRMGWSKPEVDSKIEKLKQYADLETEAKAVHPKLVQQDKQKLEQMASDAEAVETAKLQADENYRKHLSTILQEKIKTKDFDGIPLDEKKAGKAFDFLYTKKWKTPSGELLTDFDKFVLETKNPDNLSKRIKMALLAMDDFDFSKIKKAAITTESNKMFSKLVTKDAKKSNTEKAVDNSAWAKI